MPQVQKAEVRERILAAALESFAASGFAATSMSQIAAGAEVAVANLYRYYANKEALFAAAVPAELVERFERLLSRSVHAHAHLAGAAARRADASLDADAAGELLEFWIQHRLVVVVLLDRAAGTEHEGFGQRFVDRLVALTIAELRAAYPRAVISREARFVLTQIFENTRTMVASILRAHASEDAIRRAIAGFRAYQTAGLAAFARWVSAASP